MLSATTVATRATSAFAISVGSSLAFESLFHSDQPSIDPARIPPQKVNILDYQEFFINVSTLFRNLMGALPKEGAQGVIVPDLKDALINEIAYIKALVEFHSNSKTNVIFYVCNYKKIEAMQSNFITIRKDNTVSQKIYRALHNQAIAGVIKEIGAGDDFRIFDSDVNVVPIGKPSIVPFKGKGLIMTHYTWDLGSYNKFTSLDLIESHTGKLKKRSEFYTKYYHGKDLPNIPFYKSMIPIWGDSEHFSPVDMKVRKAILEVAKQNNWTQLTTIAKIKDNLSNIKDVYLAEVIKSII